MPGRHRANGDKYLDHEHDYQLTRTTSESDAEGNLIIYRFYVCSNRSTPCPERDKMEIETR